MKLVLNKMLYHYSSEYICTIFLAFIAAFIGDLFVDWIVKPLREKIKAAIEERGIKDDPYKYTEITKQIGYAERALYVFALCLGHPEFIAVWLALKTAVHWRAWSDSDQHGKENKYGDALSRAIFNLFVLGNAVSLLAAVLTLVLAAIFFPVFYGFH